MSDDLKDVPLPKAEDVLADFEILDDEDELFSQYERDFSEGFEESSVKLETEYVHLQGIRDHYRHKGRWSYFLMALLGAMIAFQWVLLWKVGLKAWDFTQYEWLLPILLVQNLGQIIGLAFIVVKSLFRELK
jgi:hypothetical protein